MIISSIDLMNGKAVVMKQGLEKIIERDDVLELAKYYGRFGELSVIDLDAAVGNGDNEALIAKICKTASCRVGGGIRDINKANRILSMGAKKIIIGTAAKEELLTKLPKDKIIIAIDSNGGKVATHAWTRTTDITPIEAVKRFNTLCSGFLYTNIEKNGTMNGINIDTIKEIRSIATKEVIAAGGISSVDEIVKLERINVCPQLGLSLYTGKIQLEEAFVKCLDFEKRLGFIPTIVQDYDIKQVLMLAYSTPESLLQSLKTAKGTYVNRSTKQIIVKGETSGNTQELVTARYNCDMDALLFKVKQKGNACHRGNYSCFEDKDFAVKDLYNTFVNQKTVMPDNANTTKLFKDEFLLKSKIMESAFSTVNFDKTGGLADSAADLMYYLLTYMVKNDVTPQDVLNKLAVKNI